MNNFYNNKDNYSKKKFHKIIKIIANRILYKIQKTYRNMKNKIHKRKNNKILIYMMKRKYNKTYKTN